MLMPQTTGTRVNIDAGKVTGVGTEKGTIRASSRPQVRAGLSSASACPAAGHTVHANQGVLRFAPAMYALPGASLLDRSRFPLSERIDSQPSTGWRLQQRRYHRHAVAQQHHRRLPQLLQKLLELRDDAEYYSSVRGFSVQSLIKNCWLARDDLDSEDDRKLIKQLNETSYSCIKRRQLRKLLACACNSARSSNTSQSTANLLSCARWIVRLSSASLP